MSDKLIPLELDETFRFACSPAAACFTACCRDLNQFLYPYDVLRLKKRLGLTSGEFLECYTSRYTGPQSGLPIVALKSADTRNLTCPFVTAEGCSVYADRPASCRIYPLIRAISRNRDTGEVSEHFMLLKEPHCRGFEAPAAQRVPQWLDSQDIGIYNHFNDQLLDIIGLKNRLRPGPLDPGSGRLFYETLYDLDNFRNQIRNHTPLDTVGGDPQKPTAIESDDAALLEFGLARVKRVLFNL